MLKIETTKDAGRGVTLHLEGRLIGPWVEELRVACAQAGRGRMQVIVDLGGVAFVDRAGIALLRELADHDTRLAGCSPFVAEQLRPQER